jgi:hypothetical protein
MAASRNEELSAFGNYWEKLVPGEILSDFGAFLFTELHQFPRLLA